MELNITKLLDYDLIDFSASAYELGQNAWKITWNNALETDIVLVSTPEQLEAARDYMKETGGWEESEIAAWSDKELNALVLQFIAGDLREYLEAKEEGPKEFERYQENYGGHIYESEDNEVFYYMGY